jgi:hypothetical protein
MLVERGEKRIPEYVANSFLDHHGWGRILFGPVIANIYGINKKNSTPITPQSNGMYTKCSMIY